jgi:hypothetical protein
MPKTHDQANHMKVMLQETSAIPDLNSVERIMLVCLQTTTLAE